MIVKEKRVRVIPLRDGGVQIAEEDLPKGRIVYLGDVQSDDTCLVRYIPG